MTAPAKVSQPDPGRAADHDPRGPQPPGPADVRGGRPPGDAGWCARGSARSRSHAAAGRVARARPSTSVRGPDRGGRPHGPSTTGTIDGHERTVVSGAPGQRHRPRADRRVGRARAARARLARQRRRHRRRDRVGGAVDRACVDAVGLDPDAEITFVAVPGARRRRPGQAGARRDERRRHRRRQREGRASPPPSTTPGSSAATRWRAASSTASTAPTATMFEGAVWVLTPDRATATTPRSRQVAAVVAELGAEVVALPPERHDQVVAVDQPRAAPHRGHADGSRQRAGRGARRAAAPRRRRLPRHDPHRQRASRHLARHLRREPHGDRRRRSTG